MFSIENTQLLAQCNNFKAMVVSRTEKRAKENDKTTDK
jgi:hypothetical protein